MTLILLTAFVVLMQLPDVTQFDIPMAEFVKTFGPFIHTLYVIVIFGEIFTTVFGNVFGLTCQLRHWIELPEWVIIFGILFVCYWVSLADFGTLLSFLYRFFSAIGFLVLFYLIFPPLRRFGQIK